MYPDSSDYGYYCTSYFYLTGSRTLTLYIQNDMVVENQFEFFYIRLWPRDSAVILDTATASVTIEDDDSELSPDSVKVCMCNGMTTSLIPLL